MALDLELVNRYKAKYVWLTENVTPTFSGLGNSRLDAMGINFFEDFRGSLAVIAKKPAQFTLLALKIYPLRIIAYLETYQFGFFDPIYLVNPVRMKNNFAPNLEFYFSVFHTRVLYHKR